MVFGGCGTCHMPHEHLSPRTRRWHNPRWLKTQSASFKIPFYVTIKLLKFMFLSYISTWHTYHLYLWLHSATLVRRHLRPICWRTSIGTSGIPSGRPLPRQQYHFPPGGHRKCRPPQPRHRTQDRAHLSQDSELLQWHLRHWWHLLIAGKLPFASKR